MCDFHLWIQNSCSSSCHHTCIPARGRRELTREPHIRSFKAWPRSCYMLFLLISLWPEFHYIATYHCEGKWKMQSLVGRMGIRGLCPIGVAPATSSIEIHPNVLFQESIPFSKKSLPPGSVHILFSSTTLTTQNWDYLVSYPLPARLNRHGPCVIYLWLPSTYNSVGSWWMSVA